MSAATVTITAEVDLPDTGTTHQDDLLWAVIAALTEQGTPSTFGVIIDRGEK